MSFNIAIDGPAGAGKSTIARSAARSLGFLYVDTGAMFRAIALYLLRHEVNIQDTDSLLKALDEIHIRIVYSDGEQQIILNNENVTAYLRDEKVGNMASLSSAHPKVREKLLQLQRNLADENDVIMDGRDIGTVVLPKANVKIFLTASAEVRARRRTDELLAKGQKANYAQILKEIQQRDYQDTHREVAPLKMSRDSIKVDTSELDIDGVIAELKSIIQKKVAQ